MTMKKIAAFAAAGVLALSMGACAEVDSVLGTKTADLTPQQKVTLAAQVINGVCVLSKHVGIENKGFLSELEFLP